MAISIKNFTGTKIGIIMTPAELSINTKQMIDDMKTVCANCGLANVVRLFFYGDN